MAEEGKNLEVAIPSIGYSEMAENWNLIHDLLGGTKAMRLAAEKWLPCEPREDNYRARLNRSILYNGYRDTKNKLANRPFSHEIQFNDIPEELEYLKNDVDATGRSFTSFAKELMSDLLDYGIAHIFVDHTAIPEISEGSELTKADEERIGARVLFNVVHPPNLIGWQTETINKKIRLTQIRIKEAVIESDGRFGDVENEYVKVYYEDHWEKYQLQSNNDDNDSWILVDQGLFTLNKMALITIYANRTGFMTAEPSLMDLAWLNLAHWQSYSDQRNILRLSRFGILFGRGFPKDFVGKPLPIGPSKAFITDRSDADLKYVEHTGNSIAAGARDIEDIEVKMEILGQQPLMRSSELSTATAKRIDESRNVSQLKTWVKSLEEGLRDALELACEWRKLDPPQEMRVDIFNDFEVSIYGNTDKELLLKCRQAGEITRERFLREEQRRGVFSGEMDPGEETQAVDEEETSSLKKYLEDEED